MRYFKKRNIILSLIAATLFIIFIASVLFFRNNNNIVQPIAFNHKIHIDKVGMGCIDCHANVETMARATFPTLETCQTCHSGEPISESPQEKILLKYIAENKEIPWIQIYKVPDHVYFSHRRHVVGGTLECLSCHGNVAEMSLPVSSPAIKVTMNNCVNCHKNNKITNDCLTCHR